MSHPLHPAPPADRSVKIPHLVFGLLFLGLAAIWALGASGVLRAEELTILGPVVLVVAGVIGLVASLAGARRRHSEEPVQHAGVDGRDTHDTQHTDMHHTDIRTTDTHDDTQEIR